MQGQLHHNVMIEMTEARATVLRRNARTHRFRTPTGSTWRDRIGQGLIDAGLRLVSRPLEVRVRSTQPVPCPPG
jgi:hypothetical protein